MKIKKFYEIQIKKHIKNTLKKLHFKTQLFSELHNKKMQFTKHLTEQYKRKSYN